MFLLQEENLPNVDPAVADGAYTGERFECLTKQILGAKIIVAKRNQSHHFAVIPKHWVVERSFAWLEKCRRL